MRRYFAFLVLTISVVGCCAGDKLYRYAKRFDESVGAQYLEYVENDPDLSEEQKQDKRLNVLIFRRGLKAYGE